MVKYYLMEKRPNTYSYTHSRLREARRSRQRRIELATASLLLTAAALMLTTDSEAPAKPTQSVDLDRSDNRSSVIINEGEQLPIEAGDNAKVFVRRESHTDRVETPDALAKMGNYLMRLGEAQP